MLASVRDTRAKTKSSNGENKMPDDIKCHGEKQSTLRGQGGQGLTEGNI